jgi:8-oxo-dGTP pyrophosphatase MutT (NUDIX family)
VPPDRPPQVEKLNPTGEPTLPRQAATIILVRGGADTLEVLLVRRSPNARWMAGVWVFPGGAVDASESGPGDPTIDDRAHRAAAVRELAEEAAVEGVEPAALVKFARWITPAQIHTRYDTHFFLAEPPPGATPAADGAEIVDLDWFTPQRALQAYEDGHIQLVFPTIKQLEQLGAFASASELLRYSRGRDVRPVEPRVVLSGEVARIVLPGEPGYDGPPTSAAG